MRRSALAALLLGAAIAPAAAQDIDLSKGGPITVTAEDGLELRQNEQKVIARGNARAMRENATVDADRLIALYRKKAGRDGAAAAGATVPAAAASPGGLPGSDDGSGSEIYRVEAEGSVRIYTPTDRVQGDRAVYDMDQAVLVITGRDLRLTTPNEVLTARDVMEYWSQKRMAVARGDAVVVTKDARRLAGDVIVAYTQDPPAGSATSGSTTSATAGSGTAQMASAGSQSVPVGAGSRLQKVEAFGNVSVRTPTETVTGDRAVYVPETGIARLGGRVRITRGQNQLNGTEAEVNLKTGISRLLSGPQERVRGLILPNDPSNQGVADVLGPTGGGTKPQSDAVPRRSPP